MSNNFGYIDIILLGMIAGAIVGVNKRIYTCRGFRFEHEIGLKRSVLKLTEKITSFLAHKVICISKSVQRFGIQNNIFNEEQTVITNMGSSNGINLDLFNPEIPEYNEIKSKLIKIRPNTLGQALRIDGVTPAAAIIILSSIKKPKTRATA